MLATHPRHIVGISPSSMTRAAIIIAALLTLGISGTADARAPIEGRWKKGNLQVDIKPCGPTLCGTVVKASGKQQAKAQRGSGTDLIGATLIRQIRPIGANNYRAKVFLADRNIHATGTIRQIGANRLAVRGCVLGVVCKTSNWIRVR
ncbi:DUF2147 domain-containing protein [Sphingomonas edaphi]|uniref:DUF2147 domain-containing protein n=2 Tax=Sphingomonas edaphi TaxID=2315689 RepID=A0A418PY24_9SPHN|nr:DUF2147 domain-containing protein [Sphingomonas edaphi]